jgi:hypothetical protein
MSSLFVVSFSHLFFFNVNKEHNIDTFRSFRDSLRTKTNQLFQKTILSHTDTHSHSTTPTDKTHRHTHTYTQTQPHRHRPYRPLPRL